MRDRAERLTRLKSLQAALYWAQFILVQSVLLSPLAVYEGYFREHTYHLSTQTFGPWLKDQVTILAVNVVLGAILFPILYGVLRRVRSWWLWGALVATVFVMFVQLIAPVFLFPLLNRYTRLEDESIRGPILSLARANGISAADVYVFDASRQTTRVSANVSGFLGTQRISLNDNMLKRCSLPEIEAAMGHEMGHFILHHPYEGSALTGMVIVAGRHRRSVRSATPAPAVLRLPVRAHPGHQFLHAHPGGGGRPVRAERRRATRRRRRGRPEAGGVPQAGSRRAGGDHLLRPPERPQSHLHGDALEGGAAQSRGATCVFGPVTPVRMSGR